jgi:hypothetical protein
MLYMMKVQIVTMNIQDVAGEIFPFLSNTNDFRTKMATTSKPALEPTLPPVQCVLGFLSPGAKLLWH